MYREIIPCRVRYSVNMVMEIEQAWSCNTHLAMPISPCGVQVEGSSGTDDGEGTAARGRAEICQLQTDH